MSNTLEPDNARLAYWSLIQNTTTKEFTRFAHALQEQDAAGREKARVVAIDFSDQGHALQTKFQNSVQLQEYLDGDARLRLSSGTAVRRRRMIILEDLARNYIEILGSRLRIHPSFFAAHWSDLIINRHTWKGFALGQPSRGLFVLAAPQMHKIDVDDAGDDGNTYMYRLDSHVQRQIMKGPKQSENDYAAGFGEIWNVVSFWCVEYGEGAWTTVVVVDPPLTENIRRPTTNEWVKIKIEEGDTEHSFGMQYPSLVARKDLPHDIDKWSTPEPSPLMLSMFDEMIKFYAHGDHVVTDDPTSCTVVFRRLILSMWIGFLDRMQRSLIRTHRQLLEYPPGYGPAGWSYKWQDWLFNDLAFLKLDMETFLLFLHRNIKALGIRLSDLDGRVGPGIVDLWEAEEWKFVETRLLSIQRTIHNIIESYVQAVSLQEAQHSNAQTHSVRRLTALATIFVPISGIAGIFSMGGKFAAGESKFWVFFAITLPIIMIILALIFTNLVTTIQKNLGEHTLLPKDVVAKNFTHLPEFWRRQFSKHTSILPVFRSKQS